jgi:hypothetical protein
VNVATQFPKRVSSGVDSAGTRHLQGRGNDSPYGSSLGKKPWRTRQVTGKGQGQEQERQ